MNPLMNDRPRFETDRFIVMLLSPSDARRLLEVLLQDEPLAARVPWLNDKTQDGALQEAYAVGLQAAAGIIKVWGIFSKESQEQVGVMIAKNSPNGIDVEALVASRYWDNDVIEEASEPLMEWLEENSEVIDTIPTLLH